MYYSYVEIEYVAPSFSPARTDLAVKLLMAIGEKDQSNLWLTQRMLPSLGSIGIQLGTCK